MTSRSTRLNLIIIGFIVLIVVSIGMMYGFWYYEQYKIDPLVNDNSNADFEGDSYGDVVPYESSMGETCPVNVALLDGYSQPDIACQCPEGYVFDDVRIGGEPCYGNAECPIFSRTCIVE